MDQTELIRVGSIAVGDFSAAWKYLGRGRLPYPITAGSAAIEREIGDNIGERFSTGDLAVFRHWLEAFQSADIWVTARTHPSDTSTPERQILAYRSGDTGHVAVKRGHDLVEVSAVPARALGAAITEQSGLGQPGAKSRVIVPKYIESFTETGSVYDDYSDEDDFSVTVADVPAPSRPRYEEIADGAVTKITTLQSSWRPARRWGIDWSRQVVVWLHVADDGDYLYAEDGSHATPMTKQLLAERINRLIAADIGALHDNWGRGRL